MKRTTSTSDAPAAVGTYSQATTNDEPLLTAGRLPPTPDGELLDGALIGDQTEQCLENVAVILAAKDASLDDIFKTTVSLNDIDDFEEFSEAYGEFSDRDPPARSVAEVGNVPKGVVIEIEVVAVTE